MRCKNKNCKKSILPGQELHIVGMHTLCSEKCKKEFIKKSKEEQREKKRIKFEKDKLKKEKIKKKKSESITFLKNKLWKIVSEYVRRRDSNENGIGKCCTCGIEKHRKEMQAGHYIPSGSSGFHRYNQKNIHIQCYGCNCGKHGNLIEYRPFMIEKYGESYVNWMYESRNTIYFIGKMELLELIELYNLKLKELGIKKQ